MVLKRRLWEMAFQFRHGWWQDLLVGIGISSLAISVIFLVAIKAGWSVIEGWIWQSQPSDVLLGKLWVSLLINALVAIVEEIAFRAYLLTGLKETWGKSIGLAVMAVTFSFMHAPALEGYPPFTIAYALLMMAAFGVMFGWVYLRTGFLWLPTGIHFA
ncbi:MAG: CAAX amino terminal protease family protein [Anaerolineae bacterium]|nr:MAG: CAAX amino terminal protease family protein [Anaerolineae bacterium]